jgi:Fe-S oxidoreductase
MGIAEARELVRACRYCFMCRYACPTFLATKRESVTSRGYALLTMAIDSGKQEWTADIVRAFYQCSLCGLGKEVCEYDWPEDELVRHARETIVMEGHASREATMVAGTLLENGAAGWAAIDGLPEEVPGKQRPQILYLAGCQTRERHPEIIRAVAEILNAAEVDWGVLAEEICCGGGLYDLGYAGDARRKGLELAACIAEAGPKTVVTGCAHCYRSLKEFYPEWGVDLPEGIEVLHTAEYLERLVSQGAIPLATIPVEGVVGYHDPCMLGRKMGVYDAPRAVIEAATGAAPVELLHSRALAECCGAGSITSLVEPEIARRVASVRLERAGERGTEVLVTACQNCKALFLEAADSNENGVQVLDLVELVAQRIK